MSILRKAALCAAMATVFASTSAVAYEKGDILLRVGAAGVYPDTSYDKDDLGGAGVDVQEAWSLGITFGYMVTDNIGIGVLGAWPFEHDIDGDGALPSKKVGSTKHLPPTVTAQWHFNTGSNFHPYVGAGINYTYFFDEETDGVLKGVDMSLEDSWGLAGEVGLDYELQDNWLVSGQIFYIDIDTTADLKGVGELDVEIDPWVYMLSVGKKF